VTSRNTLHQVVALLLLLLPVPLCLFSVMAVLDNCLRAVRHASSEYHSPNAHLLYILCTQIEAHVQLFLNVFPPDVTVFANSSPPHGTSDNILVRISGAEDLD
jgi:hypothetical protein